MARRWLFGGALAFALVAYAGCSSDNTEIVAQLDAGTDTGSTPTFVPPPNDGGGDADETDRPTNELRCIATECPSPYATCPTFGVLGFQCETNLLSDDQNCGACGNACPVGFGQLNMTTHCVAGSCQRECEPDGDWTFKDCNGVVDDGCETQVSGDANNCGACGNKCNDGVACIGGKCGCPPGQTYCDGSCIDTKANDFNCGACGNHCPTPDAGAPPPNMEYGCSGSQCAQLRCKNSYLQQWMNCNADIQGDGCETNGAVDPNNCGTCGKKCAAGQICAQLGGDPAKCICDPNETMCGSGANVFCADLQNDINNCGACNHSCPGFPNARGAPVCRKGFCAYDCQAGHADCDNDLTNGCETNLMINGANCGSCGNRCDTAAGQPCVEGKCLMTTCDAGTPQ